MRLRGKRLTAALLALCIGLGLAACGSGGQETDSGGEQLSGTVYVPKFVELDTDFDYISGGCCDGENAYILAEIQTQEEATDPETGETYTNYKTEAGIYRVDMETGKTAALENYEPSYSFESYEDGWFNLDSISPGAEGTLWVSERASVYTYDLPEDFDETTDSKYKYQTSTDMDFIRQLDATGSELQRIETTGLQEKLEDVTSWVDYTAVDSDGCIYVIAYGESGEKLTVLDKEMSVLFSLDVNSWGDFITLGDGSIGLCRRNSEDKSVVSSIDKAQKGWGADYPLASTNNVYSGAGGYMFYYNSGESLYGYNAETGEGERLLSWSAADINMDRIKFFSFLADGRLAAMTSDWTADGSVVELALLEKQDASVLADKTILTYATMGVDPEVRGSIIKFNKSNPNCRIEIRDYSEYATDDDYSAGLTKLNTEIQGGSVPDILNVNNLPLRQYGAKGLLEDLWPYIDKDPDISREDLMDRVLAAAEQDGKLYQVFEGFGISTVIGSRQVVGDGMGWTLEELQAALETMPEGCAIFGESDTKSEMLGSVLAMNLDNYVDWSAGTCNFDSDAFKAVLEFCNSFPMEFNWDDYEYDESNSEPARIANGRQMLQAVQITSFNSVQMYEAIFAGADALKPYTMKYGYGSSGSWSVTVISGSAAAVNSNAESDVHVSQRLIPGRYITYVGYPVEDGGCGSAFTICGNSLVMSSACKDKEAAWSFIRELLLPKEERSFYSSWDWGFPVNKAEFEAQAAEAMTVEYMTDGQGNQILDDEGNPVQETKGGWGWASLQIDIQATTQEEYDQVMELYNTVDTLYGYDTSIYDIINQQAGGYFSGDKSLEEAVSQIQSRVNLYINENR